MEKFIVTGGNQLHGSIRPAGNKNEALPVLAAILLASEPITIHNLPHIGDINTMKLIMEDLGVTITYQGERSYLFDASNLITSTPNHQKSQKIRGSFLLAAPLLHRFGETRVSIPGGDAIGRRRLDTHLLAFEKFGVTVTREEKTYHMICKSGLSGADIFLDEASVMATENAVMIAAIAKGKTTIYNAACEPHVQGLCHLLNQMGAKIKGIGSNFLQIEGVEALKGAEHKIQPDHTEVGSLIGLAAVTNSEITIEGAGVHNFRLILHFFEKLGVKVKVDGDNLIVPKNQEMVIQEEADSSFSKIDDAPWPGFPADLTSIMTIVATQCKGTVLIFEKLFESRLFWVDRLISMGAKIILCDPHRAVVNGPAKLLGTTLSSPDIRAGMALLIAALCADGVSEIHNIQQIDRGYEDIDIRLKALGADIQRVKA
ncbi:MAG: UDP-N-acetylglucosamine 1-carboxyvinyltransferase [bacterium]|jgi:UDP-N-acetylglucosamine 1-carboxyvinyltransferase